MEPDGRGNAERLEAVEQSIRGIKAIFAVILAGVVLLLAAVVVPAVGGVLIVVAIFLAALLFIAALRAGLERLSPSTTPRDQADNSAGSFPP